MPADAFSSVLGYLIMGTGNDNNNWGDQHNNSVSKIFEDAIAGATTFNVTGGTLDLSGSAPPAGPSQVRYAVLFFQGVLTSDQTVTVPALTKTWIIQNVTTGSFSLLIKPSGAGSSVQIPQGTFKVVICGGINLFRLDGNDVGFTEDFAGSAAPPGWLECDGSSLLRASFPDLFAKISTTWGSVDGTHFTLPNLKDTGRFRRSRTNSVAFGTYQANQNLSHTHTLSGSVDSTNTDHVHAQGGTFTTTGFNANHTHSYTAPGSATGTYATSVSASPSTVPGYNLPAGASTGNADLSHSHNVTISGNTGTMSANAAHSHTVTGLTVTASGGTEARPEAAVMITCIRY